MTLTEYGEADISYEKPFNLVQSFEMAVERFPNHKFFGEKDKDGVYQWTTYKQVKEDIDNLRGGIDSLELLNEDEAVGIISNNRSEWFICENAVHGLKCRWVPMYEKELESVWRYIIEDAEIKLLFVSTAEIYGKVKDFVEEIDCLKKVIVIESNQENSYTNLLEKGKKNPIEAEHPNKDDIAVLIYTSGTTGNPKGVLLSHGNLTFCSQSGYHIYPILTEKSVSLSILPWAHSYGISAELHNWIQFGGAIGIAESTDTIVEDIVKVKPSFLIAVPRIFNKIYSGLWQKMEEEGGIVLKMFKGAVDAAIENGKTGKKGLKYWFYDKVVYKKIRSKLGGALEGSLTASAKMNPEIAYFFHGIGIPVYDAYGMTETSPALTMNCPKEFKIGTVGKPLEKTKIVIDTSVCEDDTGEGEILAFGPQVSIGGYYKKPEKTKQVFIEQDGIRGVRTGDRGRLDDEGYLYITGRFKEEYKLENGLYIHPADIEEKIKLLPWVANCMLYGDGKPYNVCLVVPDFELLEQEAERLELSKNPKELIKSKKIQSLISQEIVNHLKGDLGGYEIPRKFAFAEADFTVDNKMLTQTMKLKRREILKEYGDLIENLY